MGKREGALVLRVAAAMEDAQGIKPCRLCVELKGLTPPAAEAVRKAINAKGPNGLHLIGVEKLYKILQESGLGISRRDLENHRAKGHL